MQASRLTCAIVTNRAAIKLLSLRKYGSSPAIQLFHDSGELREVRELRMFPSGAACIETRRFCDWDPKRNAWATDLGSRREDIDDKRLAKKTAAAMLAEIEAALHPSRSNTFNTEFFYPTPDL